MITTVVTFAVADENEANHVLSLCAQLATDHSINMILTDVRDPTPDEVKACVELTSTLPSDDPNNHD